MQEGAMIAKGRLLIDGEELPGLIRVGGHDLEQKSVSVPGYFKEYTITSNTMVIPQIELEYVNERESKTMQALDDFHIKREKKTITLIREDGDGVEYARELWLRCESVKLTKPEINFESAALAKYVITVAPQDIKYLKAG
jgi:hypothetical protein